MLILCDDNHVLKMLTNQGKPHWFPTGGKLTHPRPQLFMVGEPYKVGMYVSVEGLSSYVD